MAESQVKTVRIFLASPSDTQIARQEVVESVDRINADPAYNRHLKLELLRWDDPLRSVPFSWLRNPQNDVVDYTGDPAGTHLLVAIFRHSFGSYLPVEDFGTSPDGDPWTGTEWEISQAVDAASGGQHNEVWIYHDQADFVISDYPDEHSRNEAYSQYNRVLAFLGAARSAEGVIQRGYETYADSISTKFDSRLREWLIKHFIENVSVQPINPKSGHDLSQGGDSPEQPIHQRHASHSHLEAKTAEEQTEVSAFASLGSNTDDVPPWSEPDHGLDHVVKVDHIPEKSKRTKMPIWIASAIFTLSGAVYFGSTPHDAQPQLEPVLPIESPEPIKMPTADEELNRLGAAQNQCVSNAAEITANISKNEANLKRIHDEIYAREAASKRENLIAWNVGEEFPSLGIGHFIWYPKNFTGPFTESFPMMARYLKILGHTLPVEFYNDGRVAYPPWRNAAELERNRTSARFQQLIDFLERTGLDQARFAIDRFSGALSNIVCDSDGTLNTLITNNAKKVAAIPSGLRHMMDYGMFKGEGTNSSERYAGYGWGLRQVFEEMDSQAPDALAAFRQAAVFVLQRRVDNAPATRDESQWMAGWKNRIEGYR